MRFGLHVLLWIMLWSSLQQAYSQFEMAIEDYLAPPEVQVESEWSSQASKNGLNCSSGEFNFGDWYGPRCYSSI